MSVIFRLEDLTLETGPTVRLRGVTLEIHSGVTAVMGPSGAGKSSLLSVLAGMESPANGRLEAARDVAADAESGQLPLYWAPEGGGLWSHLTTAEHIEAVLPEENANEADKWLQLFDLQHRRQARPGTLSQGERSRLSVARCLAARPAVILMDEPLAHVDSERLPKYWEIIRDTVRTTGSPFLFTSHEAPVVLREADSVICLNQGKVAYSGTVTSLYADPPTRMLAELLGPCNWFDARHPDILPKSPVCSAQHEQDSSASDDAESGSFGVRPEHLHLTVDPESSLTVVRSRSLGMMTRSTLQTGSDVTRTVLHSTRDPLSEGTRVRLNCSAVVVTSSAEEGAQR